MSEKRFHELAKEALDSTRMGLDLLCEIHELQQGATNLAFGDDYSFLVEEIIRKEKLAVGFINQATIIERNLMKTQHRAIEEIIKRISEDS